tara:strand:- start:22 stop:516 length:495 start_codon:yes stop_codon:yes gene_type:complete
MKTLKIFAILITILLFSQCASAKFEENPPFTITSAIYNNWSGGQPGNRGINVTITYTSLYPVEFDSIYFSKKIMKLESTKTKEKKIIIANFVSSVKPDIILDVNSSKEINNTVPDIKKFPFELNQNEAIISYILKGKTKYFKVKSIKKGKSVFYPKAPKEKEIR